MEARFMDTLFNTTRYVDAFTSFVWTDMYIGYGDFELTFPMEVGGLTGISEGYYVSIKESPRYMIVESINITTDVEEGNYAVISGRSLESILLRRITRSSSIFSGDIETTILRLINSNFVTPSASVRDITNMGILKSSDPTVRDTTIEFEVEEGENVYDIVNDVCEYTRMGYRMMAQDDKTILFELYNGVDHSYNQETNPYVIFSAKFENLESSEMRMSTQDVANVCYVVSEWTEEVEKTVLDENNEPIIEYDETLGKNSYRTERVEVKKRLEVIASYDSPVPSGMDRREIFKRSNLRPNKIDKAQFGTPEDRVNMRDYMTYEKMSFDREGYNKASDAFSEKFQSMLDPRRTNRKEAVWKELKPGDSGYANPNETPGCEHLNLVVEYIDMPDESVDEWRERNKNVFDWASRNEPKEDDYYSWGWVLSDSAGYQNALARAQLAIDAAYNAAVAAEEARVKVEMNTEGLMELSKYTAVTSFEGKVDPNVNFIFGRDYNLGDIVQIVNEYGFQATTRVVGMEFSEEEGTGFVARPTFKSDNTAEVTI